MGIWKEGNVSRKEQCFKKHNTKILRCSRGNKERAMWLKPRGQRS